MSYIDCPNSPQENQDKQDQSSITSNHPILRTIVPRTGDIGNFTVHRALPFRDQRMVGPFIFWDQMGPGEFLTNQGVDVRPHPHIGLSTVTYLFEGSLDHKDSLGNALRIHPGDVNLMRAGHGIVHSERTGQDIRKQPSQLFGIQSWLALPKPKEQTDPSFAHITKQELPTFSDKGYSGRLIMGSYEGLTSPVHQDWETLYMDLSLEEGASFEIPATCEERAVFSPQGVLDIEGIRTNPSEMIVLKPGRPVKIKALRNSHENSNIRILVLGGAAMDGPRYIDWNFVASTKEQIEEAKLRWRKELFPIVPDDQNERIPLPG